MSLTSLAETYRLSEEQRIYAANHLNEEENVKDEKIKELQNWLASGGGNCTCVVFSVDQFFILRFLRCCKFDVEMAKKKIQNYYKQRINMPEWYAERDPYLPKLRELFDSRIFMPLRKSNNDGTIVIIVRPCSYDPNVHTIADVMKVNLMILDIAMRNHVSSTLYGVIAIVDIQGASLGHVLQLRPHVIKQLVSAWQDCYPLRIKGLHFVNSPTLFNVVFSVMKSFMKKKLRDRMYVHSRNMDDLLKTVQKDILPPEYGGNGETFDTLNEYWKTIALDNNNWYAEEDKHNELWMEHISRNCLNCKNS